MADQHRAYQFKTFTEKALTLASAAAGLAAFGAGLAAVFNPIALGVAGAYAAYKVGGGLLMPIPAYRNWAFGRMVRQGHAEPVSEDADICRLSKEISDALRRPLPPKIYTIDLATVATMAFPLGLRWLVKLGPMKDLLEEKAMPKVFAAIPGANVLLTTKEALAANRAEAQLRFVVAHEMSHLKTDAMSPALLAKSVVKKVVGPLTLGLGAALALSLFHVALPVAALGAGALGVLKTGAALMGVTYGSGAAVNFGMRLIERRADRNALYITRDLEGAQQTMEWLHEDTQKKPSGPLKEATLDHPSYTKRMVDLATSFNFVAKYPPLQPINDNAVPKAQAPAAPRAVA